MICVNKAAQRTFWDKDTSRFERVYTICKIKKPMLQETFGQSSSGVNIKKEACVQSPKTHTNIYSNVKL